MIHNIWDNPPSIATIDELIFFKMVIAPPSSTYPKKSPKILIA